MGTPLPDHDPTPAPAAARLVPVLPLQDLCLFPRALLTVLVNQPEELLAAEMAERTGGTVVAVAVRDPASRELHAVGTLARLRARGFIESGARRIDLEGLSRVRVARTVGVDLLVAEVSMFEEGEEGEEWGPAVEALARYLHAHPELRDFLDGQRRSSEPMAWVSLACQHLPITASARQKLLEADARQRCMKISRGLDALLRKEQGA